MERVAAAFRIGVDVGGTFTDVALERPDGTFASIKVLTTHQRPEEAVLAGISAVIEREGTALDKITQIIHGTTLATNALIERRGARTALVTTAGFRDVIETRTESRFEQYDLNIVLPAPLIERKDRFVVPERVGAGGEVLRPFDVRAARTVVAQLVDGGYESVAVGFMHSYRNPDHERRFRDLLREATPSVAVSLSCEVSPQMREFERFNTVCANAYVQPLIATYLRRLESELQRMGAACPLLLIHSGGGLISSDAAASFPVRLVESGPAGGAIFAAHLAGAHRRDRIVSYDMGGTTAKIALIEDCSPRTAKTFETARTARFKKGSGMPISVPTIEMIEIGAGGGSIAAVDTLGQIRVGPHSAGAEPGPACYALGGTAATVTDANVQLGRLHPENFLAPGHLADAGDVNRRPPRPRGHAPGPRRRCRCGGDSRGRRREHGQRGPDPRRGERKGLGRLLDGRLRRGCAAPRLPPDRQVGHRRGAGAGRRWRRLGHRVPARSVLLRGHPQLLHQLRELRH